MLIEGRPNSNLFHFSFPISLLLILVCRARKVLARGVPTVTILFGSETGTAECYAKQLGNVLEQLKPTIATLNDAATEEGRKLLLNDVVLIITSTFGAGSAPFNALNFLAPTSPKLPNLVSLNTNQPVKLAVCAIGSSVYPDFCAYGRTVWFTLKEAGIVEYKIR